MRKNRIWFIFPLLGSALLLASCQENPFGTDTTSATKSFTSKIFPNGIWDFVIQLIAFVFLILIVFFFAYKPVKKMLAKRREAIERMVEETDANKRKAQEAADKAEMTIEEGKKVAGTIVEQARAQAQKEREEILRQTQAEVVQMKKRADEEIEAAKEASKSEVRGEIVSVAMLASEKILGREVSSKDNERLVTDFVASLQEGEEE